MARSMPAISIIVPVLNEASGIAGSLAALAPLRQRGVEVIVVDGGSQDDTASSATPYADSVIVAPRSRASQMNAGAAQASADLLLFLHVDTQLPPDADTLVVDGLAQSGRVWGRFDVRIDGRHPMLSVVATMINLRSRLSGIQTGDQAIFVAREAFTRVGGFPQLPLMEDIAISKRLKRLSAPLCLREQVITSGRRCEKHGVFRTILLMWRLRFAYWCGTDPADLAKQYGYTPSA